MAIPQEILAVQRPSSTVVKQRGERYVVIKRTSKRVGKRVVPVDVGMVGEIVGGKFVETVTKQPKKAIDIKDYGEVTLCNKLGFDLLQELASVWSISDAKRLYVIALLRAAFGDVKNGELQLHYMTSFASEYFPGVHLSEQAVSAFLMEIGQAYSLICEFMRFPCEAVRRQKHRHRRHAQGLQLEGQLTLGVFPQGGEEGLKGHQPALRIRPSVAGTDSRKALCR
jgi:hypothetical protein